MALTAVRSRSLRFAEPEQFHDLYEDAPFWRIPAANMKLDIAQKQQEVFDFIVPLSPEAVEVVKLAKRFAYGQYLFPNIRFPNKPMSENALSVMYRRLLQFSGRHVPHGWRATFSMLMNDRAQQMDRPSDRAIIDLMLAHKPQGVEARYNRASFRQRRREIAREWAELLVGPLPPPSSFLEGRRR